MDTGLTGWVLGLDKSAGHCGCSSATECEPAEGFSGNVELLPPVPSKGFISVGTPAPFVMKEHCVEKGG